MKSLISIGFTLAAQNLFANSPELKTYTVVTCGDIKVTYVSHLSGRLDLTKIPVWIVDAGGRYAAKVSQHSEGYDFKAINSKKENVTVSTNVLGENKGYAVIKTADQDPTKTKNLTCN